MSRTVANAHTSVIRSLFRWAEARRWVRDGLAEQLKTLRPLRPGRTLAPETERVRPVDTILLKRTFRVLRQQFEHPFNSQRKRGVLQLRCMLGTQLRTGMRPAELCGMRWSEIDHSAPVWVFEPAEHKTKHHGKRRRIRIGPKAQRLIRQWCEYKGRDEDVIFGSDQAQYRRKLKRWLDASRLEHWHPYQLRHLFATRFGGRFGVQRTRLQMGHASRKMTEHYIADDDVDWIKAIGEAG